MSPASPQGASPTSTGRDSAPERRDTGPDPQTSAGAEQRPTPNADRRQSLTVFILILAAAAVWAILRHSNQPVDAQAHNINRSVWQQPAAVSERHAMPIAGSSWNFDYAPIEALLMEAPKDRAGRLLLNSNTADLMNRALSYLPDNLSPAALERIKHLTKVTFPGESGQQLAKLLTGFMQLEEAMASLGNSKTQTNIHPESAAQAKRLLEQKIEARENFLGKQVTQQLFGKQQGISRYLLARREIRENQTLDTLEKQKALSLLKAAFESRQ